MNRALALLAILILLPLSLGAQQQIQPAARRMLLVVDQANGGDWSENELLMISRSLLLSLQRLGSGILVIDCPERQRRLSDSEAADRAHAAGADCWLRVELAAQGPGTTIHAQSVDLLSGKQVVDATVNRDSRLSFFDVPYEKWTDIVSLVQERYAIAADAAPSTADTAPSAGPVPAGTASLTIRALPGTLITAGKGVTALTDGYGTATFTLASPAEYSLRAVRADFYPTRQELFVSADRTIELPQARASRWAVEGSLLDAQYPGVDVTRFVIPNWVFVRLGFTTYQLGLALSGNSVFSNEPLTNFALQGGAYFRPEDALFRFYGTLGGFLRVITQPGQAPLIDPLAPGGIQVSLGTEILGTQHGGFFFEWAPMLYFTTVPGLMQASFGDNDTFGWLFWSWGSFSALSFRVGYRWLL